MVANGWNAVPAPVVEPLVNVYLATGNEEALDFARAYAEGIIAGAQPNGIRFGADGNFGGGHGHGTLHALWGVAHLGLLTGEGRYVDFVKRSFDWMLAQGTGTGWFPAAPEWAANCNETCCISDMMSIAALIARAGHPEYFDYVERYLRNYISNLQFIVTPQFAAYYRELNAGAAEENIEQGLEELRKFQGGIIGGSGLNDFENELLGRVSCFEMFGCCAPEGMRAIYTSWSNAIDRIAESALGPAGVYVNLCLGRDSEWGRVVSFFPDAGRLTVKAGTADDVLPPPTALGAARERAGVCGHARRAGGVVRGVRPLRRRDARPGTDHHLSPGKLQPRGRRPMAEARARRGSSVRVARQHGRLGRPAGRAYPPLHRQAAAASARAGRPRLAAGDEGAP